ncbi:hypothetical protein [Nostoc sp. 'Peltigera membranacea cyanobiont' 232]|uniref:PIN-like domain-containing protein n=1 Tax=Nostoc sp. 'Peltigera membranacea cyanobiont' 232 TaxID=2014531 RepID=UPI00167B5B18
MGKRGWVVLTKDGRISNNLIERIAVARAQVKMFIFASQSVSGLRNETQHQQSLVLLGFTSFNPTYA